MLRAISCRALLGWPTRLFLSPLSHLLLTLLLLLVSRCYTTGGKERKDKGRKWRGERSVGGRGTRGWWLRGGGNVNENDNVGGPSCNASNPEQLFPGIFRRRWLRSCFSYFGTACSYFPPAADQREVTPIRSTSLLYAVAQVDSENRQRNRSSIPLLSFVRVIIYVSIIFLQ